MKAFSLLEGVGNRYRRSLS